jgi:hypothetical protein
MSHNRERDVIARLVRTIERAIAELDNYDIEVLLREAYAKRARELDSEDATRAYANELAFFMAFNSPVNRAIALNIANTGLSELIDNDALEATGR